MSKHYPQKEVKQRHLKPEAPAKPRRTDKQSKTAHGHADFGLKRSNLIETAVAAVLFITALFFNFTDWLKLAAFAVPLLMALYRVLMCAVEELANRNFTDDSIPAIIAAVMVFAAGDYCGGAAIMVFYRLAKLIEALCERVSEKMYARMKKTLPECVLVETDKGTAQEIAVQNVAVGDIIRVLPGDTLAFDGVILSGMSAIDTSYLTDSKENYTVTRGSRVFSGCVNVDAPIRVKVLRDYFNSLSYRVCDILENASRFKADFEKRADKLAGVYSPIVFVGSLLLALIPSIITGQWTVWPVRAGAVLALGNTAVFSAVLSLCFLCGVAVASQKGVIIKGTRFVEALARTKTMIFNKTGSITEGRYTVLDVVPKGMTDYDLLLTAARAEQYSAHPIARALCAACGSFERDSRDKVSMEEIPGRGVSTVVRGEHIYVGNAALLEEHGVHCDVPKRGGAAIHIAKNGKYCGYIVMSDRVREGAFDVLEELRVLGVKNTVLLTGDVRSVARTVASSLNFDMVKPELTPDSKVSAVEYLLATKPDRSSLAVVSDRASDIEALERADVGISLASLGSGAALSSADVIIMADGMDKLPECVRMAKLAYGAALQNAAVFVLVRLLVIILCLSGAMSCFGAVLVDLVLSLGIFANAYRIAYKNN